MRKSVRWTIAFLAFLMLALVPSEHLWRAWVFAAVISALQLIEGMVDMHARNWFMHTMTLHDVIKGGAGHFGDADSIDSMAGAERPA